MKRKYLVPSLLVLVVSGCVTPLKITQNPTTASYKSGFNQERISSDSTVVVRSYAGYGKERKEIGGATCKLDSLEFTASVVTPGKVIIPTFRQRKKFDNRGRPSDLRVSCHLDGKSGTSSFDAQDKKISTATNAGVMGAIITTVVSGAIASVTPWRYSEIMEVDVN